MGRDAPTQGAPLRMKARDFGLLVGLGTIWGLSFIFIRVAAPVVGPVPLMAFRYAVGGSITLAYVGARGGGRELVAAIRAQWPKFLLLGIFLMALPTVLIGYAELQITAALASVLNASTPFFAAGALYLWFGETLAPRQVGGLVIGFIGVAIAVGGGTQGLGLGVVPFAILSVVAACCYGFSTVYVRKAGLRVTGIRQGAGAQSMAALALLPFLPVTVHPGPLPTAVIVAALGLALLSTALAYIVYFHLIAAIGAAQASMVTYISPIAGVVGGGLLLGEPIGVGLIVGLALIFLGILLTARESPLGSLGSRPTGS